MPLEAKEMREVLDKHGLKVVVSHRKFADFLSNLDEVIDYNKTLGCDVCGVGMTPYEYVEDNETVSAYIKEINRICDVLKAEMATKASACESFEQITEQFHQKLVGKECDVYGTYLPQTKADTPRMGGI